MASDLDDTLAAARARWGVPAIGGAIMDAGGGIRSSVQGVRRRDGQDPVRAGDAWHIGSCGKSMTATVYARLVEQGRARWDASVGGLFEDLAPHPGWDAVTISDVLLHRGGIPELTPDELEPAYVDDRPAPQQRSARVARLLAGPPRHPGRFVYSNLGYTVAGAAIERLTDNAYEQALHEHIFDRLGMPSAGFGAPDAIAGHPGRMRVGNLVVGRGAAVDPADPRSDNPPLVTPAGRLHVTLEDWAKFLRVFLVPADAETLAEASVDRLLTLPPGSGTRQAMGWAPADALGASFGQQGSNTAWVATALLDARRRRAAMVVVNDGRTRLLAATAVLAGKLLAEPD